MSYKELKDASDVSLGWLPESKEGGRLRNIVYIKSTAEYAKPAWLKFAIVKGVGGGGGGGGVATTSTAQKALSGGGSGAGYFEKKIAASTLSASETVTVGAAGAGGVAGNNTGGTGGATSLGSHCSATGGGGGAGAPATTDSGGWRTVGSNPGIGTGGDINISGFAGAVGQLYLGGGLSFGVGGQSVMSGQPTFDYGTAAPGAVYGGGGCGAYVPASTAAKAGGAGAPGIVIIEEYE